MFWKTLTRDRIPQPHDVVCDLAGCAIKLHFYRGTKHEAEMWDELKAAVERFDTHMGANPSTFRSKGDL